MPYTAQAEDRGKFRRARGNLAAAGRGGDKLASSQAYPPEKTDPVALALRVLSIPSHSIPG